MQHYIIRIMVICDEEQVISSSIFALYAEIVDHQCQSVLSYKRNVNTSTTMKYEPKRSRECSRHFKYWDSFTNFWGKRK